jgi:hypothetical protein
VDSRSLRAVLRVPRRKNTGSYRCLVEIHRITQRFTEIFVLRRQGRSRLHLSNVRDGRSSVSFGLLARCLDDRCSCGTPGRARRWSCRRRCRCAQRQRGHRSQSGRRARTRRSCRRRRIDGQAGSRLDRRRVGELGADPDPERRAACTTEIRWRRIGHPVAEFGSSRLLISSSCCTSEYSYGLPRMPAMGCDHESQVHAFNSSNAGHAAAARRRRARCQAGPRRARARREAR